LKGVLNGHRSNSKNSLPSVGIIMLDTSFPRIKGDIENPATFEFPVQFKVVEGASPEKIVLQADKSFLQPVIEAGLRLIDNGAEIIATSCGFLALFHNELTRALTEKHLEAVGIEHDEVEIVGMEDSKEFLPVFID